MATPSQRPRRTPSSSRSSRSSLNNHWSVLVMVPILGALIGAIALVIASMQNRGDQVNIYVGPPTAVIAQQSQATETSQQIQIASPSLASTSTPSTLTSVPPSMTTQTVPPSPTTIFPTQTPNPPNTTPSIATPINTLAPPTMTPAPPVSQLATREPLGSCDPVPVNLQDGVTADLQNSIWYVVEEWDNNTSPRSHKFIAKQGPDTVYANAIQGTRGWECTNETTAQSEALRTAIGFKTTHPNYKVYGPDDKEINP